MGSQPAGVDPGWRGDHCLFAFYRSLSEGFLLVNTFWLVHLDVICFSLAANFDSIRVLFPKMKKKEKVFYCTIMALCPDLIPTTLFSLVSECDGTVKDFNDLFAIFYGSFHSVVLFFFFELPLFVFRS